MDAQPSSPSPAPWMFADRIYGLGNCLIIFNNNYEDQGQRNGREMIALLAENP